MRLLILLVSLAAFAMPAIAQSAPPENASSQRPHVTSTIVAEPETGKTEQATSPKVRTSLQRALTEGQERANQCFTLETYAPKMQKLSRHPASVEKPYVPQTFALRSTCTHMGTFETIPLSAPSAPGR